MDETNYDILLSFVSFVTESPLNLFVYHNVRKSQFLFDCSLFKFS